MAGTTRLELATSAVTVPRIPFQTNELETNSNVVFARKGTFGNLKYPKGRKNWHKN
jgi:hypothetical protein